MAFEFKRDDTEPMEGTLSDRSGVVDLTGADVLFSMRQKAGTKVVSGDADIVDAEKGTVRYVWAPGDTDTAGNYDGEFKVTFSDGAVKTFPNDEYLDIVILPDLV